MRDCASPTAALDDFLIMWKDPPNTDKYVWTDHAKMKMRHYGLSGQRVVRVIRRPMRTESGIAGDKTVAVMQPQSVRRGSDGQKTWSGEIWVMYKMVDNDRRRPPVADTAMANFLARMASETKRVRVISAWRYPGKTTPGEPLPEEILDEIAQV